MDGTNYTTLGCRCCTMLLGRSRSRLAESKAGSHASSANSLHNRILARIICRPHRTDPAGAVRMRSLDGADARSGVASFRWRLQLARHPRGKNRTHGLAAAALASPGQDRNRMSRTNREEEQEQEPEQSGAAQEAWMVHTHARRDHPIKISAMSVLMNILWNIFVKNACVFT